MEDKKPSDENEQAKSTFLKQYSEEGFWEKAKSVAQRAGLDVLEQALKLYYSALDDDTPKWAKVTIFSALGYFIAPLDAIPDITPVAGFSDDLGVLAAAVATVLVYIKDEHGNKAKEKLKQWFPD
ncbi:hypothetical protein CS022_02030 [Veronia nyctiphanis]|uniref:DUF1232 domain-containing protein n=1 Tax=Veronia nyctiphanis TaxID=1278244 RepID=A0A4Q0YT75_9GAMM|nr:YkvA family protein [Veronia nyctiphanis]RXJ74410.1 hypothetical protein CS022_02030 [Veronia nyctiphanis]